MHVLFINFTQLLILSLAKHIKLLFINYIIHCRENPVNWKGTTLYFRGAKILEVVMDAILAAGGDKIEHVILTGCSGTIYVRTCLKL